MHKNKENLRAFTTLWIFPRFDLGSSTPNVVYNLVQSLRSVLESFSNIFEFQLRPGVSHINIQSVHDGLSCREIESKPKTRLVWGPKKKRSKKNTRRSINNHN